MASKPQFHAPDIARLPISVNLRAISLAEGFRAALSVSAIIAAGQYLDFPPLREAALGALLTCLCDPGGPIGRRVPVLLSFTFVGAMVTAGFGLVRELGPAYALPLGVFGLFCSSFVRIYGQAPQQLGVLLSTVQILALDRGDPSVLQAGIVGLSFIGGGLWATLLTLVIWRIYPFLPARKALSACFRQLAELVADLHGLVRAPATSDADWDAHARIHRRAARDAIEAARTVIMDTLRARGAASARAAQGVIRMETADQLFGALIALSDLLERGSAAERQAAERILRRMRPVLLTLARAVMTEDMATHWRIDRAIDAIAADKALFPPGSPVVAVIDRIAERLRIAHTVVLPPNRTVSVGLNGQSLPFWQQVIRPLRANLNWQSAALRHALRCAVTAAPALAYTMVWFSPYDHWLTITVVATMQPYYSLTYTRAVERIVGTALGGVVAAGVGLVCTTPLAIAAAMFPLAMLALSVRAVSFGLFMAALTPLVVLLVETGTPGTGEWQIAGARAALTTLGGIIAVAAGFLLWPSRERELVAAEVRNAIAAHGAYAEADFSVLLKEAPSSALGQARRAAGVASNALEALITRALLDPTRKNPEKLEAAMVVDAALRRCAGRLTTLRYDPATAKNLSPENLRIWRDWIGGSLRLLASGQTDLPPRPEGGETESLARLARQIELMAGAVGRLG
nr:FUSC family protein [uncultured Rhodopila sp.]